MINNLNPLIFLYFVSREIHLLGNMYTINKKSNYLYVFCLKENVRLNIYIVKTPPFFKEYRIYTHKRQTIAIIYTMYPT